MITDWSCFYLDQSQSQCHPVCCLHSMKWLMSIRDTPVWAPRLRQQNETLGAQSSRQAPSTQGCFFISQDKRKSWKEWWIHYSKRMPHILLSNLLKLINNLTSNTCTNKDFKFPTCWRTVEINKKWQSNLCLDSSVFLLFFANSFWYSLLFMLIDTSLPWDHFIIIFCGNFSRPVS